MGRSYSANGASLTFQNLSVNPHVNGPARLVGTAALFARRERHDPARLHFLSTNIAATNGKVDHCFNFQDGSNMGVVISVTERTVIRAIPT